MNRAFVLTLFFLALLLPKVRAQFQGAFNNTFFSVGMGPNFFLDNNTGTIGFGLDVGYGKWLINTVALRAQLSAQYVNGGSSSTLFAYGHMDGMLDIITSIKGRNTSPFRSYLLAGLGVVHSFDGDNDFCGLVGIGGNWRMSENWWLVSELHTIVHSSEFNKNSQATLLPVFSLGFLREFNTNLRYCRSRYETQQFGYDWFIQTAFGACSFNYRGKNSQFTNNDSEFSVPYSQSSILLTPVFGFGIGKALTKNFLARAFVTGLRAASREELFSYYNASAEIILDVVGWLAPKAGRTLFTIKPYLGPSFVTRLDSHSNFMFGANAGVMISCRPDSKNEVYIDARYVLTPPRFAHVTPNQGKFSVGLATVMLGYGYNFTRNSF